jgi:hypothetical protein
MRKNLSAPHAAHRLSDFSDKKAEKKIQTNVYIYII